MQPSIQIKVTNILTAFAAAIILLTISVHVLILVTPEFSIKNLTLGDAPTIYKYFMGCLVAPVVEETLFRYFPMQLIRHRADYQKLKIPVVIGISIVFGWMHGNESNILVQGVAGICLFWVYIKNGHSLLSSIIVHSVYNFYIFTGLVHFI